jgi:hypothetical protein
MATLLESGYIKTMMTKNPETENDYYIRLTGKGYIPEALDIGHNYEIRARGTITSYTESDNNDGSHAIYYKFMPIVLEVTNEMGESIKAKDPRSLSQIFRARLWKCWNREPSGLTFDQYYEGLMSRLIQNVDEIAEMYSS